MAQILCSTAVEAKIQEQTVEEAAEAEAAASNLEKKVSDTTPSRDTL